MKVVRLLINLFILFFFSNIFAQNKERSTFSYLKRIENVQIFNFIFLMPEINKIDISDSSFFKRYSKSIANRINFAKKNHITILSNIELLMIRKNLDTIINSSSKYWRKDVFKKLKSLTPISNDTILTASTIKGVYDFSTDETNVEEIIFYTLFIYDSEKLINISLINKEYEKKLKNWEESFFPFSSCDYLPYAEILIRQRKYLLNKYMKTKNLRLKQILKEIQNQAPDC